MLNCSNIVLLILIDYGVSSLFLSRFLLFAFPAAIRSIQNKCFVLIFVDIEHKRPERSLSHLD